ncbi:hypothetical protein [Rhodococcus sp. (in: high G+C Gram-positive bacteria)]|uniref:hypothetical protein n=1 Tax=Rhodococcus sp. TaxID=1831 RepID=UPI003B8A7419
MNTYEINEVGVQIFERWASEAGFDVQTSRSARVAIDGDESKLAIVKATTASGFRVVRPECDSGALIQVRIGEEDGGSNPRTEIVVIDVHTAWGLPAMCRSFDPSVHDQFNWARRTKRLDRILGPLTARTPLELGDLLAAVRSST